jgi:hypothetical protein
MAGFAIRLYEITIEGSDAAGNVDRDQCRVIIIPSNMTIQDADAIVQKSSVRFPVAATTDMGIMLETKTNIILRYVYDMGQALTNKIDASHSITDRARERDLMVAGEERGPTMLHFENTLTKSNIKQSEKIRVDPSWIIFAAVGCVGVGFVAGVGTVFLFKNLPK